MKFGLIGYPIAHSLSPRLFEAGYDGKYEYELIQEQDFETAWKRFLDTYDGINVTAPFKEEAFAKADMLSEECRMIGATNLLVKTPEGIKAHNSDFLGVREWLSEQSGKRVLIVGTGGAGKAAAVASGSLGLETTLINRTQSKARNLAERLPQLGFRIRPIEEFAEACRENDIVIYTLPEALSALPDALSEESELPECDGNKIFMEANYRNPGYEQICSQKGWKYVHGSEWLLRQAATGYSLFTGKNPDIHKMSKVFQK